MPETLASKSSILKATHESLAARFFAIDLRSLAVFRIGLAGLLLFNLALRARDLEAFYTDRGVLPRSALPAFELSGIPSWSVHALSGDVWWQVLLFVLSAAFASALGVGWRTTFTTACSWLLLVSLENRNPLVLTGGDIALKVMLFWSMFLPLGRVWSLDSKAGAGSGSGAGSRGRDVAPSAVFSMASAALLLQVAVIYPVAAIFKWREPVWRSLEAFSAAMSVDGVATSLGQAIAGIPHVPEIVAVSALLFEGFGVLLAFVPWQTARFRFVAVALFVAFHLLGIGLTFRVGYFPLVMAVAWIPFLPPFFWRLVLKSQHMKEAEENADPSRQSSSPEQRWLGASNQTNAVVAILMLAVVAENGLSLGWVERENPLLRKAIRPTVSMLGLAQKWSLWSLPPTNRYFLITAKLADGREVDVRRDGAEVDWRNPPRRSLNSNWWKLELGMSSPEGFRSHKPYGCSWLRAWHEAHPDLPRPIHVQGWIVEGTWEEVNEGRGQRNPLWTAESESDWLMRGVTRARVYPCDSD